MGNRVITLVSLFTTVFFIMLTCALGYILYVVGDPNEDIFWLLTPLFIGMFLATLVCIGNINKTVKISKSKLDKILVNDTSMTTCPNYWMKQIVYDPATKTRNTMCYNIIPNTDPNKIKFIDGPLIKISSSQDIDGVPQDMEDFRFTTSRLNSNLSFYRNMASSNVIEGFMEGQYYSNDNDNYLANYHYHDEITLTTGENVTPLNSENPMSNHSHVYNNIGRRGHSHSLGWEFGMDGANNGNNFNLFEPHDPTHSNLDHWISARKVKGLTSAESTDDGIYAIEINLDKLNAAANSCELAKLFNWSEQKINCFNKI